MPSRLLIKKISRHRSGNCSIVVHSSASRVELSIACSSEMTPCKSEGETSCKIGFCDATDRRRHCERKYREKTSDFGDSTKTILEQRMQHLVFQPPTYAQNNPALYPQPHPHHADNGAHKDIMDDNIVGKSSLSLS